MTTPIRILIAEDETLMAELVAAHLQQHSERFHIVGIATDGEQARALSLAEQPDVLLLDIDLPHRRGYDLAEELKRRLPAIKILMMTHYTHAAMVRLSLAAGADGYFIKFDVPQQLVGAIETVMAGHLYLSPRIQREVASGFIRPSGEPTPPSLTLSTRERQILLLIAEGKFNRDIAATLHITERAVEKRRAALLKKFNVTSTSALMVQAAKQGLV